MLPITATPKFRAALLLSLALLVVSLACRSSAETRDETDLIWEAWDSIQLSYVNKDSLDSQVVVGNMVQSLLDLADEAPYPFLTEVGRMRGQPPVGVAPELSDVWRALTLHREKWPEFQDSLLVETAIRGMVESLDDPSAVFLATSEDYARAQETLVGSYEGIGASVAIEEDRILLFPFPDQDTQAEKAGIEPGDVLLEVDGESVAGLSVEETAKRVRGPAGTRVKVLVERAGEPEPLEYNVFRGDVDRPSIVSQAYPAGIWYIGVRQFLENTGDQVAEALETFKRFSMLALILDLRSNPGGSPEAARLVASQFLHLGDLVMYEVDLEGNRTDWVTLEGGLGLQDVLMVVLTNEGTAGVAEAVAAALQDADRATIIGTQTFGKATTNNFVELSNGSAIYLPTSRWYTLSGQLLEGTGIQPDLRVPFQLEDQGFGELQFNRAYDHLNSQLPPFR